MNIYVGNLPYSVGEGRLREVFSEFGTVNAARVVEDRETRRSKGFGFVEMANDNEAKQAIEKLNGQELDGRTVVVTEARPREDKPAGERRGGFGGGERRGGFGGERRGGFGGGERRGGFGGERRDSNNRDY